MGGPNSALTSDGDAAGLDGSMEVASGSAAGGMAAVDG